MQSGGVWSRGGVQVDRSVGAWLFLVEPGAGEAGEREIDVLARMSDEVLPYKKGTNGNQHALSLWQPTPC